MLVADHIQRERRVNKTERDSGKKSERKPFLGLNYSILLQRASKDSVVAWGTEATMDYKVNVSEQEIKLIAEYFLKKGYMNEKDKPTLERIAANGLESDKEASLDGSIVDSEIAFFRSGKRDDVGLLEEKVVTIDIGGSPAISAKVGHHAQSFGNPETRYWGSRPRSIELFIKENGLEELFTDSVPNDKMPATLSFECGKYKLMMSEKHGRELKELRKNGNFSIRIPNIGDALIAIGGLNKGDPSDYLALIVRIKELNPEASIFVGTNSFGKQINNREYGKLEGYFNVLRRGDIVSMNEAELDDIHEGIKMQREKKTRTEKLSDLNLEGLVVVHSHAGVKIYLGTGIDNEYANVIEEVVKTACYATTFYIETGRHAKSLVEIEQYYSERKEKRNIYDYTEVFGSSMNGPRNRSVIAPYIPPEQRKGSITGAGAIFDGYLCSFLAPIIKAIRNEK